VALHSDEVVWLGHGLKVFDEFLFEGLEKRLPFDVAD
jgi:hypothetical protein